MLALLKPIMIYSGALLIVHAVRTALYLSRRNLSRLRGRPGPDKPDLEDSVSALFGLAMLAVWVLILLSLILP